MEINAEKVRALASESVYRTIFELFAQRERNPRETTVHTLVHQSGASRSDVIALFKSLAELELGRFILGRRESPSRFEWHTLMNEVGQTALGEADSIQSMSEEEIEVLEDADIDDGANDLVAHSFRLRPNTPQIVFNLPSDFTAKEAERLAAFLKTVPIE